MTNKVLTIVAKITSKPEYIDFIEDELKKLIPPTLSEEGCINYDLHQDNKNPNVFLFYENWTSYELWQNHMNSAHLKDFSDKTEGKIEDTEILEMTPV